MPLNYQNKLTKKQITNIYEYFKCDRYIEFLVDIVFLDEPFFVLVYYIMLLKRAVRSLKSEGYLGIVEK